MEYRIKPARTCPGWGWEVYNAEGQLIAQATRAAVCPSLAFVDAMVWVQGQEEEAVAADPGRSGYDPFEADAA